MREYADKIRAQLKGTAEGEAMLQLERELKDQVKKGDVAAAMALNQAVLTHSLQVKDRSGKGISEEENGKSSSDP
jgi:hypothetical protein